jgi:hypothetical protein
MWSNGHRLRLEAGRFDFVLITTERSNHICGLEWPQGSGEFYDFYVVEAISALAWTPKQRAEFLALGGASSPRILVENYDYGHGKGKAKILKKAPKLPVITVHPGSQLVISLDVDVSADWATASVLFRALGYRCVALFRGCSSSYAQVSVTNPDDKGIVVGRDRSRLERRQFVWVPDPDMTVFKFANIDKRQEFFPAGTKFLVSPIIPTD